MLSPDEEKAILDEAPDFVRPIITLAANTGMRLGEIVNLKWTDVDRKNGAAVLGGFIRVGAESKGHRARHIPINAVVKDVLDRQPEGRHRLPRPDRIVQTLPPPPAP